jgi:hypothetical protein
VDADIVIGLFKVAGALIAGALGVAALLADYRDPVGKLSRAGIAVFAGIVISSMVGVVTSVVETQKARSEGLEQAARTEALLREISRAVQPIRELRLSYWIELPQGHKVIDDYVKRVTPIIEERLPKLTQMPPPPSEELKGYQLRV